VHRVSELLLFNATFGSYVMTTTSYIPRDDNDIGFVLDQHAQLDCYSGSPLKQPSACKHVAPLGHIILIPSQPVFALSP